MKQHVGVCGKFMNTYIEVIQNTDMKSQTNSSHQPRDTVVDYLSGHHSNEASAVLNKRKTENSFLTAAESKKNEQFRFK